MIQFWNNLQARKKLIKTFKKANLYLGNDERPIFPKIHTITPEKIVFTLPAGLDPSIIKKNFFVFQQVYGKHVELNGELNTFVLSFSQLPKQLTYNYNPLNLENYKLPILAGMDKSGKMIVYDMVQYPHLLIAGETGSGKSTQLRSILTTLLLTLPPERLQLYLCDLKRTEFHIFRNVKHVQGPFITARQIMPMLELLRLEMQKRGDILDYYEVVHVDDLPIKLPYIILCIDEVALLKKEKVIMEIIEEISSIGRALGVFLILSMQRPDRDVLDGKLKVNLTVRMGFKTADRINSRIIGTPGSEMINQVGKFLLKAPVYDEPNEVLAPNLSLNEAKQLLEGFKSPRNPKAKPTQNSAIPGEINSKTIDNNIFGVLDE